MTTLSETMTILRKGCVLGTLTLGGCDEGTVAGWPAKEMPDVELDALEGAPALAEARAANDDAGPGTLELTDEQRRALDAMDLGVVDWSQPRRGVFEGADDFGTRFTLYGSDARELYMQELAVKLERLEERVAEDPDAAQTLDGERTALEREIEGHRQTIASVQSARMNSQDLFHTMPGICKNIVYARSMFSHVSGSYFATTEASFPPLGSPPQFGPIPPPALSIYRYAYARAADKSAYQDQMSGMAGQKKLSASSTKLVFPNACTMETRHSISATCSGGDYQFTALTTSQTCKGVAYGDPPLQP